MQKAITLLIAALCVAMLALPAMAQTPAQAPATATAGSNSAPAPGFAPRYPRYEVRAGDTLSLEFPFSPEFNQQLAVQPDGFITLQGVGDVYVEGKALPQITGLIKKEYAGILHDPVINVVLKGFEQPHFIVNGQVMRPGKFELRAATTVTEAIGIAGGFSPVAKHSQVLLFRRVSDQWYEVKKLNVKAMLKSADLREDVLLQPGDMLYVPQSAISKIRQYIPTTGAGMYANPF